MAEKFNGLSIRAVDSNDDIKQIGIWGEVQPGDFDTLSSHIDAGAAVHGLKVIGKVERYYDDAVDVSGVQPPAGKAAISGNMIISREGAGPVYFKGKFPNLVEDLDLVCQSLITGTKTVGSRAITEVVPRVNTGRKFSK